MSTSTQKMTPLHIQMCNGAEMANLKFQVHINLQNLLQPETELESRLLETTAFQEGMNWGKPRFGHPEGKVGLHVKEVLHNIDRLKLETSTRRDLRLSAFIHDTFKFQEQHTMVSGKRVHHGILAREFASGFIDDIPLLEILELHDEAFYTWRQLKLNNDPKGAKPRLHRLIDRLGDALPLYFLFFKCDTETGDKILAPMRWFENTVREVGDEPMNNFISEALSA